MKVLTNTYWIIALVVSLFFGSFDGTAFYIVMFGFVITWLGAMAVYYILKQL